MNPQWSSFQPPTLTSGNTNSAILDFKPIVGRKDTNPTNPVSNAYNLRPQPSRSASFTGTTATGICNRMDFGTTLGSATSRFGGDSSNAMHRFTSDSSCGMENRLGSNDSNFGTRFNNDSSNMFGGNRFGSDISNRFSNESTSTNNRFTSDSTNSFNGDTGNRFVNSVNQFPNDTSNIYNNVSASSHRINKLPGRSITGTHGVETTNQYERSNSYNFSTDTSHNSYFPSTPTTNNHTFNSAFTNQHSAPAPVGTLRNATSPTYGTSLTSSGGSYGSFGSNSSIGKFGSEMNGKYGADANGQYGNSNNSNMFGNSNDMFKSDLSNSAPKDIFSEAGKPLFGSGSNSGNFTYQNNTAKNDEPDDIFSAMKSSPTDTNGDIFSNAAKSIFSINPKPPGEETDGALRETGIIEKLLVSYRN